MTMYSFNPNIMPSKKDVYIVGGSVRDLLLGLKPADYDLVVCNSDAESFARQISEKTLGHYVCLGKDNKQIHRVVTQDIIFDISSARGPSIESDLKHRDFTINAMAFCLETDRLIDITGGQNDLENKVVRIVSNRVFKNDPIRMQRAFRIAADLGFSIDPVTMEFIQKHAAEITLAAPERIREEWFKLLSVPNSYPYLIKMVPSGLLFFVFPEIQPLMDCEQNSHHAYNVFDHTIKAYQSMERLLNTPSAYIKGDLVREISQWDTKRKALLKHTLLVHDIGKPASRSVHSDGSVHFYKHAAIGADMVKNINRRLRFSNDTDNYITTIVKYHNRPLNLFILKNKDKFKPNQSARFFNQSHTWVPDILLHSIADHLGKGPQASPDFIEFVFMLANDYFNCFKPKKMAPKLLTGDDLIAIFDLYPSPVFKDLLDQVEDHRLAGEITSREEAIACVEKLLLLKKQTH